MTFLWLRVLSALWSAVDTATSTLRGLHPCRWHEHEPCPVLVGPDHVFCPAHRAESERRLQRAVTPPATPPADETSTT